MAKPRIFISSTYYDLKHIRSSIENFVESLGYEPILFENGNISYNPDSPLDESCYIEAKNSDIFVLIIGGKYGSPASFQTLEEKDINQFYAEYESITRKEYESARKRDIPIYVLVEKAVFSEYETFKRNRSNEDVNYAHVSSINVFHFIEKILNQPRNNPVHTFENYREIETWLKEQWAGLFRDFIRNKSEQKQLANLTNQVEQLSGINQTLKTYLESIIVEKDDTKGKKLIKSEQKRLSELQKVSKAKEYGVVSDLTQYYGMDDSTIKAIFTEANSLKQLSENIGKESGGKINSAFLYEYWSTKGKRFIKEINEVREIFDKKPFQEPTLENK